MTNDPEVTRLLEVKESLKLPAIYKPAWHIVRLQDLIDDEIARLKARRVAVFKPKCRIPGRETWAIHYADEPERLYPCELTGMFAAWLAIRDAGQSDTVRSGDFAAPGARRPDNIVRDAIRETLVPWLEKHVACPELVAAVLSIKVERGIVRYEARVDGPIFDTGG